MLAVIEYLQRLSEVIRSYCKGELTENAIRDKFVVIYQVPPVTEANVPNSAAS